MHDRLKNSAEYGDQVIVILHVEFEKYTCGGCEAK